MGGSKIKRIKKLYTMLLIALLLIGVIVIGETSKEIDNLKLSIEEKEVHIASLTQLKQRYEELVKIQEELEEKINIEIDLLQVENKQLRTIRAKLTAYSPLDNVDGMQAQGNPNITSTGKQVSRGYAAADPRRLPYGTKLEVPGYGEIEIQDTGGALRKDNKNIRIDLFHETYPQAMKFGVKDMEVKILEWGTNEK